MISVEDTYPGRATPADASYPEGSIKNETIPNSSGDGTPLDELWGNDFEGLKQAIARSASIVPIAPGDVPDTATDSQILQGLIEMMQGRAINYDETGIADAYVLAAFANQQLPASLFDGQRFTFIAGNAPTGASTIDIVGLGGGLKALKNNDGNDLIVNYFKAGDIVRCQYDLAADEVKIDRPVGGEFIKLSHTVATGVASGAFTAGAWQTRTLNTEDVDTGNNCVLVANQFTLDAGTYEIIAHNPAYQVNQHNSKLRNITDASDEIIGSAGVSGGGSTSTQDSWIVGEFTITVAKVFQIQHWCVNTNAGNGFGSAGAAGAAINEIYGTVILRKVK